MSLKSMSSGTFVCKWFSTVQIVQENAVYRRMVVITKQQECCRADARLSRTAMNTSGV